MTAEKPAPGSDYDQFVDWGKRLARETPFFRRLFDEVGARSVIDVGAGSARHAIEFAASGMAVDAVDPSESMLAQAEVNVAEAADRIGAAGGELRLLRGGFGELAAHGLRNADALVCTGNALPHVAGREGLREALADFSAVLRPGGAVMLHLLNHARLLSARIRTIPPVVRDTPAGTKLFLRVIDYPGDAETLDFDFLTLARGADGEWQVEHRRSPHTALPFEMLRSELEAAGFQNVEAFGNHDGKPFDAEKDESLIVVARRS